MNPFDESAKRRQVVQRTYTRGEVATGLQQALEVEVDPRQLENWVTQGFLEPAVQPGETPAGNRREYDWGQILGAAILVQLRKLFGSSFRAGAAKALTDLVTGSKGRNFFVPGPGTVLVWSGRDEADMNYHTQVQHLPLSSVVIRLDHIDARLVKAFSKI